MRLTDLISSQLVRGKNRVNREDTVRYDCDSVLPEEHGSSTTYGYTP